MDKQLEICLILQVNIKVLNLILVYHYRIINLTILIKYIYNKIVE